MLHDFELKDADGKVHHYQTPALGVEEGQVVFWELVAAGAEPLAQAAAAIVSNNGKGTLEQIMALPFEALLADVDLGGFGRSLRSTIMSMDMAALRKRLLRDVIRDGQQLADPDQLDAAYRRNHWELAQALWEVIRLNRFFPL